MVLTRNALQYAAAMPFSGDPDPAFGLAVSALTSLGFRLTQRTPDTVELVGPGMNSTRQSPLVGASRVRITGGADQLAVEADLGGVQRMSRFVTLFPVGLCLGLGVLLLFVFGVLFGRAFPVALVAAVLGANALLWLILGPIIARGIKARTCRGLDALLSNMVAVGQSGSPVG